MTLDDQIRALMAERYGPPVPPAHLVQYRDDPDEVAVRRAQAAQAHREAA